MPGTKMKVFRNIPPHTVMLEHFNVKIWTQRIAMSEHGVERL